ncbi:MAG: PAS domain S-box protein [Magnetococcales bacterium]|nr:PAS domain S-box protein [Magnetococcales bacterium]
MDWHDSLIKALKNRSFIVIGLVVFSSEVLVMFILHLFPAMETLVEAMVDGAILSILITLIMRYLLNSAMSKKEQELERQRSELGKYWRIVSASQDHMSIISDDYVYLAVNDAHLKAHGKSRQEMEGQRLADLLGDEVFQSIKPDLDRCLSGEAVNYQAWADFPEIGRRWIDVSYHPYVNATGRERGVVVITRDATERKEAEEAQQRSEELFRLLLEKAADGVVIHDLQGRIIKANRQACSSLGYSKEQLAQRTIRDVDILLDDPEQMAKTQQAWQDMEPGEGVTIEGSHRRADGTTFPVEVRLGVLDPPDGERLIMAFARDITERKQVEERLRDAKRRAEEATLAKSTFLASMSHEIRSPMNAVIGMTDLALSTELTREQRQYLEIVLQSSNALLSIINSILDFSKIESGKLVLEQVDFDPVTVIEQGCETLAVQAHNKGLDLLCHVDPMVPHVVNGDPIRLRQIIINLVGNAIKFTHEGEVIVRVKEDRTNTAKGHRLNFSISDTGIGIKQEKLDLIFDSFSQAEGSTTRKFGGTGLGLAIAKELTAMMDGELRVESKPNRGSVFYLNPVFQTAHHPRASGVVPQGVEPVALRVLVIERNRTARWFLVETLSVWGYTVIAAGTADQALAALQEAKQMEMPFDLTLLDCHAFGVQAENVQAEMRDLMDQTGKIIVMLYTGQRRHGIPACSTMNVARGLIKPVRRTVLIQTLEELFSPEKQQQMAQAQQQIEHQKAARCLHILVVEDQPNNQQLAVNILTKAGHQTAVANHGLEALALLSGGAFDLVLMDLEMPELDGLATTERIRAGSEQGVNASIPIIALTARAMDLDRKIALSAGMNAYLSKPFRANILLATIEKVMAAKTARPGRKLNKRQQPLWKPDITESADTLNNQRAVFLDSVPALLENISNALQSEDEPSVEAAGQRLKQLAADVGADRIRATVMRLLLMTRKGHFAEASHQSEKLQEIYNTSADLLNNAS